MSIAIRPIANDLIAFVLLLDAPTRHAARECRPRLNVCVFQHNGLRTTAARIMRRRWIASRDRRLKSLADSIRVRDGDNGNRLDVAMQTRMYVARCRHEHRAFPQIKVAKHNVLLRAWLDTLSGGNDEKLSREPEALGLRLEARAKNLSVERVFEAVAHERGVVVLDIHVELVDILDEEIQNLAVVGELPAWENHLIGAFLVELAQPGALLFRV